MRGGAWILLMLLPACASTPERHRLASVPGAPAPGAEVALSVATDWWSNFGNADLDRVVAEALAANPDLVAAAARVEAAVATARMTGADAQPQVQGIGTGSRSRRNFIGFPGFGTDAPMPGLSNSEGPITSTSTSVGVSLEVSWELDLWGRVRAAESAALADVEAVQAQEAGARLSLAAQTCKAWWGLAAAREQARVTEEVAENRREALSWMETRYAEGLRTSPDVEGARISLAGAEASLAVARLRSSTSARALEVLLGRYPIGAPAIMASLPELPGAIPSGLSVELVARRPDVVAAERAWAAADQRADSARRNRYPRLAFSGSGGTTSEELGDLIDGDFSVWSLVGNIVGPLFQGGRIRAGIAQADAVADEAAARFAATTLAAFAEVEDGMEADRAVREEARALQAAAESAQRLEEDFRRRHLEGVVDRSMLLDAQERRLQAEARVLDVRRRLLDQRANLHLAIGGGWTLLDSDPTERDS